MSTTDSINQTVDALEAAPAPRPATPGTQAQVQSILPARPLGTGEKVLIMTGLAFFALILLSFAFGGSELLGYVWARTTSDVSAWLRDHILYFLEAVALWPVYKAVGAYRTIQIPISTGQKSVAMLRKVRYRNYSVNGPNVEWLEKRAAAPGRPAGWYRATVNRRWVTSRSIIGSFVVTTEVERVVDEDAGTIQYQSMRAEVTRSALQDARIRAQGRELSRLAHSEARRGGA
jgi:hypothetical protein